MKEETANVIWAGTLKVESEEGRSQVIRANGATDPVKTVDSGYGDLVWASLMGGDHWDGAATTPPEPDKTREECIREMRDWVQTMKESLEYFHEQVGKSLGIPMSEGFKPGELAIGKEARAHSFANAVFDEKYNTKMKMPRQPGLSTRNINMGAVLVNARQCGRSQMMADAAKAIDQAIAERRKQIKLGRESTYGEEPMSLPSMRDMFAQGQPINPCGEVSLRVSMSGTPSPEPVQPSKCPECKGHGEIALFTSNQPCDRCDGTGEV